MYTQGVDRVRASSLLATVFVSPHHKGSLSSLDLHEQISEAKNSTIMLLLL